jgi:hypothetical protein
MGTLSAKKSSGNETVSLVFLIVIRTLGLVFTLLYTYMDVNCCYIQVISLITNGVHVM